MWEINVKGDDANNMDNSMVWWYRETPVMTTAVVVGEGAELGTPTTYGGRGGNNGYKDQGQDQY